MWSWEKFLKDTTAITVKQLQRLRHQVCGDVKEDFVSGVLVSGTVSPEQLKHRFDHVRDEVLVVFNMTLQQQIQATSLMHANPLKMWPLPSNDNF